MLITEIWKAQKKIEETTRPQSCHLKITWVTAAILFFVPLTVIFVIGRGFSFVVTLSRPAISLLQAAKAARTSAVVSLAVSSVLQFGQTLRRALAGWNSDLQQRYECSFVSQGSRSWTGTSPEARASVSSPLSHTSVMARKIRIYVIELTSLIVRNKDDSLMLLGFLADSSGKRTSGLCGTLRPHPSQRQQVAVFERCKPRASHLGFRSQRCHLLAEGLWSSDFTAAGLHCLLCKWG